MSGCVCSILVSASETWSPITGSVNLVLVLVMALALVTSCSFVPGDLGDLSDLEKFSPLSDFDFFRVVSDFLIFSEGDTFLGSLGSLRSPSRLFLPIYHYRV